MNEKELVAHIKKVWDEAECLVDGQTVERSIAVMAGQITEDYADKNPLLLCLMKGAVVFMGQLLTKLPFPLEIDYIHASRYGDELTGEHLNWVYQPKPEKMVGRHIILIDDIFDQGATLAACVDWLKKQGAASVEAAVLVEKKHDRVLTTFEPKYTGVQVPDEFVVGYGMDYRNYFRNANGIFKVAP